MPAWQFLREKRCLSTEINNRIKRKASTMVIIDDIFAFLDQFGSPSPRMETKIVPYSPPVPPVPNGKRCRAANPSDILNGGTFGYSRKMDPASLPLGNCWHGARKKDHGYRGAETVSFGEF